jgi:hypothetical protein
MKKSYLKLKICKIIMILSELVGSYLIVILTFKNSEEGNVLTSSESDRESRDLGSRKFRYTVSVPMQKSLLPRIPSRITVESDIANFTNWQSSS